MTPIRFSPSSLKEARWHEYLIASRSAEGRRSSPGSSAVVMEHPSAVSFSLFPPSSASATLIEKHETRRKREAGLDGVRRGREAAALDAAGAAVGALGMLSFAILFWLLVENSVAAAFVGASLAWLGVSVAAWYVRRKIRSVRRAGISGKTGGSAMSRSRGG
jgi:hypothetical protein